MSRSSRLLPVLFITAALTGCSGPITKEASYPTRPEGTDKILYSDQKRETLWGGDDTLSDKLFGNNEENSGGGGSGLGVNSFLWRAALDTISFMPVASADPFGGVILTDWYENPKARGERFKINLYILDKQLRADGLRISVFKQKKNKTGWQDTDIASDMANSIENTILTRAREMRVAQLGLKQN
jgi:hypothetical protein